jgi:glycerate 2-kinase
MHGNAPYEQLKRIFRAAIERVDPYRMMMSCISLHENLLIVDTEYSREEIDLGRFDRIVVVGAGKASSKMAKAVEEILGERIAGGVLSVKYGHTEHLRHIQLVEAGHPVPDENSIEAARRIEDIAARADDRTLCIVLISGGGSSLLVSPAFHTSGSLHIQLTLREIRETTSALLSCSATIDEMNCVRKHLSRLKGGRLARLIYPGRTVSFILSDVVGDSLDTIASGLTTPDRTTFADAVRILRKYELERTVPGPVLELLRAGEEGTIEETPKQDDPAFSKVTNILIGTNYTALLAAANKARELGYNTAVVSSRITGEAREAAKVIFGIAKDILVHDLLVPKPACFIAGGETTVTIRGGGRGGRNQELALSFLSQMKRDGEGAGGIYFLSASTDGNDGPTDAAGAFASAEILRDSERKRLDIEEHLRNNDSYTFFNALNSLLKTGPTNTNVCDVHIALLP